MKKIVVKDANVFIDLDQMNLLGDWLKTDYVTITSSLVMDELRRGGHDAPLAYSLVGFIESVSIPLIDFQELYIELESRGLSLADTSVLHLAIEKKALLLTGDGTLRAESKAKLVKTHGTIWVLREMIEQGVLAPEVAADRLEDLIAQSDDKRRYLPKEECREQILSWRKL